jgi:transposase
MSGTMSKGYPPELRERAVRMVEEIRPQHASEWAAMGKVASLGATHKVINPHCP